ncbi:hypothetical protein Nepgr_027906 [Nepenthes gracilis]|uniref:G-patch domain-containing protein n=1 Tax=Nepenthes gracilis TaxID=150966 RepID=A0AAD3TBD8_NEPGR|nr:hypothetical protein Nepgr_027906 [Nepenthes gracilis]
MTTAQRMVAKMGWKEGQGLGKQEKEGIAAPLMVKKTDRRAGMIVNNSERKQEKTVNSANLNGPPTRVMLLRNMVCLILTRIACSPEADYIDVCISGCYEE